MSSWLADILGHTYIFGIPPLFLGDVISATEMGQRPVKGEHGLRQKSASTRKCDQLIR